MKKPPKKAKRFNEKALTKKDDNVDEKKAFKIDDSKKLKKESAPQKENLKIGLSCKICHKELADKQTLKVLFRKLQESNYLLFTISLYSLPINTEALK